MIYADFQEMKTDRLRLHRLRRTDAQAFFHFAGSIDLLGFKENDSTCSFAYMLAEEFRGRGFGTEAMTAVLNFAFQNMQVSAVGRIILRRMPLSVL